MKLEKAYRIGANGRNIQLTLDGVYIGIVIYVMSEEAEKFVDGLVELFNRKEKKDAE